MEFQNYQGHNDFQTTECELYLYQKNPFVGASPDGIAKCSCHEEKCLIDVKCPYSKKDVRSLDDAVTDTSFFLDSDKSLKRNHKYF